MYGDDWAGKGGTESGSSKGKATASPPSPVVNLKDREAQYAPHRRHRVLSTDTHYNLLRGT
eukprot:7195721-Prorocentrum_lima.AAC.1